MNLKEKRQGFLDRTISLEAKPPSVAGRSPSVRPPPVDSIPVESRSLAQLDVTLPIAPDDSRARSVFMADPTTQAQGSLVPAATRSSRKGAKELRDLDRVMKISRQAVPSQSDASPMQVSEPPLYLMEARELSTPNGIEPSAEMNLPVESSNRPEEDDGEESWSEEELAEILEASEAVEAIYIEAARLSESLTDLCSALEPLGLPQDKSVARRQ